MRLLLVAEYAIVSGNRRCPQEPQQKPIFSQQELTEGTGQVPKTYSKKEIAIREVDPQTGIVHQAIPMSAVNEDD